MNARSDRPVLRVLESDAAGRCEPDGGACTVPGAAAATQAGEAAAESPVQEAGEVSGAVLRAFSRPTPV